MLDIKPNSAFLSARNSARQVVNSAQNSAEILLSRAADAFQTLSHILHHVNIWVPSKTADMRIKSVGFVEMTQRTVLAQLTNGIDQQSM